MNAKVLACFDCVHVSVQNDSRNSETASAVQSTCHILRCFFLRIIFFLFPDYLLSSCIANAKDSPTAKQMNEMFTQQVSYAHRKQQRLASKLHKMTVPEWLKWQVERILLGTQCNIYYYYPAKS